jgi:formiminoglutamate deiminase
VTAYWCELAWLGGDRAEAGVLVEVEGGRFHSVEPGVSAPPAGAERLPGIAIPGLANSHSHAFQRALRARAQSGGSFWSWRERMYELAGRLDPDSYLALARATFAEMALAGVTSVGEFHYLHHGPDGVTYSNPNAMSLALAEAARQAGVRLTLLDTCYLRGGVGEEPSGAQRRFSDGTATAWADRVEALEDGPGLRVGAAIHSVRAVEPGDAAVVAAWANERERPLHAHVSEQPDENDACVAVHGRTPAALLEDAGAVSSRFTAVHATHLSESDVGVLGGRGATCCICPTTERDLGDGIAPARALADAGARLSLGTDSHAAIDLLEEARALELDERLAQGRRGIHATGDLMRAAAEWGHASLGWPDAGRIEAGALADLVTLGLDSPRLAGTDAEHALEAVAFAASAADVTGVMAGGEWVVRDGAHVRLDVASDLDSAVKAVWS